MSASEVKFFCQELRASLLILADPVSGQEQRDEAQQFCDDFKVKSPLCIPSGLSLADKSEASVVRHFGLQVLEDIIKFRWSSLSLEVRTYLKSRVLGLIATGTASILEEEASIKDALTRIMVEMIQQDWPTGWPTMLSQLEDLSKKGESQAELVLLILLRLAEEVETVHAFKTGGLFLKFDRILNMIPIFSIVENVLQVYVEKYKPLETDPGLESQVKSCCCVIVATINVLASYMKWVPARHIEKTHKLLKMLWYFLDDLKLQLEASECLLIAIDRIGSRNEIIPLLAFFKDAPIHYLSPAQTADGDGLTERHYSFLKKQCRLVCVTIEQICCVMQLKTSKKAPVPENFEKYIDLLLDFTRHSSRYLSSLTQTVWKHVFSCTHLSLQALMRPIVPKYLRATRINLVKVGFPSKNDSPSCDYSRLDFVSDDDFCDFLTALHDKQKTVIKAAYQLDQEKCYQTVFECLEAQLSAVDDGVRPDSVCLASTESIQQWEAVTLFVKIFTDCVLQLHRQVQIPVSGYIEVLRLLMKFKTKDTLISACIQANISTLSPIFKYINQFSAYVISNMIGFIDEIDAPKEKSLRNVRRSVCSCFIQMCQDNCQNLLEPKAQSLKFVREPLCTHFIKMYRNNAQNLLNDFGLLNELVKQVLGSEKLMLMPMEKSTLTDALVIVINQFKNYEKQKALLAELLAPIVKYWPTESMNRTVRKIWPFLLYTGAYHQTNTTAREKVTALSRSKIIDSLSTILGVLKWSRWPTDLEEAKTGGFVIGFMQDGKPMYRNPCTELVKLCLPNMFLLLRILHKLYTPIVIAKLNNKLVKDLYLPEVEYSFTLDLPQPLLDIFDPPGYKTEMGKRQTFFRTLYDICFSILGQAASSMNNDFYTMDNLFFTFCSLRIDVPKNMPYVRLLSLLRAFLKPLLHSCPPEYYERFLCPILKRFLDIFRVRLLQEWTTINQSNMENKETTVDESTKVESAAVKNPEPQNILESQLKVLTCEVMEFIFACCVPDEETGINAASNGIRCQDSSVVSGISNTVYCVSTEDADNTVNTAESDDDENEYPSVVLLTEFDEAKSAAEVPLLPQPVSSELGVRTELTEVTMLAVCMLKDPDSRKSLLLTVFSSLLWNHSFTCNTILTRLCWPLLKNVVPDDLTFIFTLVLQGILKHMDDHVSSDALVELAYHIYKSLRPRDKEFHKMIHQLSDIKRYSLKSFDLEQFSAILHKQDHMLKHEFAHLIKECFQKPLGNLFSSDRPHIPAAPFRKRKSPPIPITEPNNLRPSSKKLFTPTM